MRGYGRDKEATVWQSIAQNTGKPRQRTKSWPYEKRKSVSVGASLKYFDGKVRASKLALGLFGDVGALENIHKCRFGFVEHKDAKISEVIRHYIDFWYYNRGEIKKKKGWRSQRTVYSKKKIASAFRDAEKNARNVTQATNTFHRMFYLSSKRKCLIKAEEATHRLPRYLGWSHDWVCSDPDSTSDDVSVKQRKEQVDRWPSRNVPSKRLAQKRHHELWSACS